MKAFNYLTYAEDYPEIEGLKKEVVRRKIRKLKMRLKFCTGQTCQKCAKVIVKDYSTPKKVFETHLILIGKFPVHKLDRIYWISFSEIGLCHAPEN